MFRPIVRNAYYWLLGRFPFPSTPGVKDGEAMAERKGPMVMAEAFVFGGVQKPVA